MIDYLIKLDYVLGYQRFQNRQNAFKPEETCQILMDVKFSNLGIFSMYFVTGLFRKFDLIGNQFAMYSYLGFLIICIFWFHFKVSKKISQAPIRKLIKKMSEKEKKEICATFLFLFFRFYSVMGVSFYLASNFTWYFCYGYS